MDEDGCGRYARAARSLFAQVPFSWLDFDSWDIFGLSIYLSIYPYRVGGVDIGLMGRRKERRKEGHHCDSMNRRFNCDELAPQGESQMELGVPR